MPKYCKIKFPNYALHGSEITVIPSNGPGEEDLYKAQLHIVKNYLETQSVNIERIGDQARLSALHNAINKVEEVYARTDRRLRRTGPFGHGQHRGQLSKSERAELFDEELKLLNEVLANLRLIYLPPHYGSDLTISWEWNPELIAILRRMPLLSHTDYSSPQNQRIDNFKLLMNQLAGANNTHYLHLGIALLMLSLLSVAILIILANPSMVGLIAGNYLLPITLVSITAVTAITGSLTFFTESCITPKLAQTVQELAQMTL